MEDNTRAHLKDWIITYLKNRDLMFRKIESVEQNKGGFDFCIKFKDKEQFFIVQPVMDDISSLLSKFNSEHHFGIAAFNTHENFDFLVRNWGKFAEIKNLSIYFINPFSNLDKKWIIHPYTHNNICEKSALAKGLRAMFDTVEPLTGQQIKDRFK